MSTSLHELNISGGKIKLSGYISDPCDNLSIKVEWSYSCLWYCNSMVFLLLDFCSLWPYVCCCRPFNMSVSMPIIIFE